MDAYARHQRLIQGYLTYHGNKERLAKYHATMAQQRPNDVDILKQYHRFIRQEEDDDELSEKWEARIAKKYYDKLYKEYCLADLSQYKQGRVAMRWRTANEVISGKGQFECGHLTCHKKTDLKSWEVNFGYMEAGQKRNALVKLRLCTRCSYKLNYRKIKEKELKRKRRPSTSPEPTTSTASPQDTRQEKDQDHHSSESEPEDTKPSESIDTSQAPSQPSTSSDGSHIWRQLAEQHRQLYLNADKQEEDQDNPDGEMDVFFADLFQ